MVNIALFNMFTIGIYDKLEMLGEKSIKVISYLLQDFGPFLSKCGHKSTQILVMFCQSFALKYGQDA